MPKTRGRPRVQIDEAKVLQFASFGASADEIAAELDVSKRTLWRQCGTIIKKGAKKRDLRLRSALFRHAVRGNAPILIFLAKVCLGMRENDPTVSVNVTQNANLLDVSAVKEKLSRMHQLIREESLRDGNGDKLPADRFNGDGH